VGWRTTWRGLAAARARRRPHARGRQREESCRRPPRCMRQPAQPLEIRLGFGTARLAVLLTPRTAAGTRLDVWRPRPSRCRTTAPARQPAGRSGCRSIPGRWSESEGPYGARQGADRGRASISLRPPSPTATCQRAGAAYDHEVSSPTWFSYRWAVRAVVHRRSPAHQSDRRRSRLVAGVGVATTSLLPLPALRLHAG
jgi:hypothetical protein